jgi:hypothetical protein
MKSSQQQFKDAIDKEFGSMGAVSGDIDTMMSAQRIKGALKEKKNEKLKGGKADKKTLKDVAMKHAYDDAKDTTSKDKIVKMLSYLKVQLEKGMKVEKEHTKDVSKAKEIALDHLWEDPKYYVKLKKVETKEVTGSGSSGSYVAPFAMDSKFMEKSNEETPKKIEAKEVTGASSAGQYSSPAMWAKSTNKKDWRGASKPLYQGGKFVQVKGKCKKFPYCNQGDIKALKIWENEKLSEAIESVSKKTGLNENVIKNILYYEMESIKAKKK